MKRAAVLLSVTGYAWYSIFAFNEQKGHPDLGTAILQLALLCLLPTLLGYFATEKILKASPTMLKLLGLNLLYFLLYTFFISGSAFFLTNRGFWPEGWSSLVFTSFWQLISWSLGVYPLIAAAEANTKNLLSALRSMEISLVIIPAVFLLTYMEFSPSVILLVIISWFTALSLSLLTQGVNSQGKISFRYDIIVIHSLIPFLLAFILFLTAFSAEAFQVLDGFLRTVLAFLVYLAKLLDSFFKLPPQSPYSPKNAPSPGIPEEGASLLQPSGILTVIFMVLAAILIIMAVMHLIKMLRIRITLSSDISPIIRGPAFSIKGLLQQILLLFVYLYKSSINLFSKLKQLYRKTAVKISEKIKNYLPPKTSVEAVYRCYRSYLRWAGHFGIPRGKSETPLEHAYRLQESRALASQREIYELTMYYLETCYSTKTIDWEQAHKCRNLLNAIKKKNKLKIAGK